MMSLKAQAELYQLKQLGKDRNFAQNQRYRELRLKNQSDKMYIEDLKWKANLLHVLIADIAGTNNKTLDSLIRGAINKGVEVNAKPFSQSQLKSLYVQQLKMVQEEKKSLIDNKKTKNQNH